MMNKSNEIYRSRINKVIDYVNINLDKPILLEELASISLFSRFNFNLKNASRVKDPFPLFEAT